MVDTDYAYELLNCCSNRESRDVEDIEEIENLLESYHMQVCVCVCV